MSSATLVVADLDRQAAVQRRSARAAVSRDAPMRPAELACVVLLLQASMAVVSSALVLILLATGGFPVPLGRLGGVGLMALAHPTFLVVLAIGTARSWRGTRRTAIVFECLTVAGTLANLALNMVPRVEAESGPLVILVNLVLPATIVGLLKTRRRRLPLPSASTAAATLIFASAAIHALLAPAHAAERPELGRLFVVDAVLLAAAALGAVLAPRWPTSSVLRRWRPLAIPLLVANVLAYVVYIGSGREHVEQTALAVKLVEIVALGLLLFPGEARDGAPARRPTRAWTVMIGSMLTLTLLTGLVAWAAGLKHHDIPAAGEAPLVMEPVPGHSVRRKVVNPVTAENEAATARLVEETRLGAARYTNLEAARAAGYVGEVNGPQSHLENTAFKNDDAILDPTRPEQIVYAATPDGPLLLGVVYVMPTPRMDGPEIGGSLTRWHTHTVCLTITPPFIAGLMTPFGTCPFGAANLVLPEMMHVWIVENPSGQVGDRLDPSVLKARGIR